MILLSRNMKKIPLNVPTEYGDGTVITHPTNYKVIAN